MRSAEQRARRAEKEKERRAAGSPASKRRNSVKKRERRAAESPASRQARLASGDKAATRRHRQALESSIAENQHMRAEHRRRAAVVAEARCARRDATHNDAFDHLIWLHSCSGSLGVMNARRLSHSRTPASRLLSRLLVKTYSRMYNSTFLCQLSTWLDVFAISAMSITMLI